MKNIVKRAIKDEKGAALALALVLLVVGGLVLTPLLGLMSTGLIAGQVYEKKTDELYAADAGVEYAVWEIRAGTEVKRPSCATDPTSWNFAIVSVNNKSVEVYVEYVEEWTFGITSTAITADGSNTAAIDSTTTVEAYVEPVVFDLLSGALVSSGDIGFHKGCIVSGDVYYVGNITGKDYTHTDGVELRIPSDVFPTQAENEAFADELKQEALKGGTWPTTDIEVDTILGPKYIDGDLTISRDVTITLAGTVYVRGGIRCENTLTITGTGSLVAEGEIYLSKLADYAVTGDSIIMSLNSDITLKKSDPDGVLSIDAVIYAPNGTIEFDKDMTVAGSVIGAGIQTDKDGSFTYVAKGNSFGFFDPVVYAVNILTYEINPLESQ